jgi:peptidyl-prolyl cis-trans isomerase SurA
MPKYMISSCKLQLLLWFSLLCPLTSLFSQKKTIDKIIAVVGDKAILLSEVEGQYLNMENQNDDPYLVKCALLEEMIIQKLLLNQAEKDSVVVGEEQVDAELNKKIRYFINQMGSVEKLESFLGKSILQIKNDYRDKIRDQMVMEEMQRKIAGEVRVSPAEVKAYFYNIPIDSIPLIESEIQLAQILIKPPVNESEKKRVRDELMAIRNKISEGRSSFASMAAIYSEDPGSAAKGGELGFINRGEMVPEFEAAAFSLKGKEISDLIETTYGYHIIQLIERRGETINVRHILMSPKPSTTDLDRARNKLDSLSTQIRLNKIAFEDAALRFSDDQESKNNGGVLINPATGSTWFPISQMDQSLFFIADKLKTGEISEPVIQRIGDKKEAYRIIRVVARTDAHAASLEQDYQRIQVAAEESKRSKLIREWISRKRKSFYIKIEPEFQSCKFQNDWTLKP